MSVSSTKEPGESDPLLVDKRLGEGDGGIGDPVSFVFNLSRHVGSKLLILLFCIQHLLKGLGSEWALAATPYVFQSYGVPAPVAQIYTSVASLPDALKPIIGLVSDTVPIFGYNKAPYVLITSVPAIVALLCAGLVPHDYLTPQNIVTCMFFLQLQMSTADLLSEAKYAEKIQDHPSQGPNILTFVWFGMTVGGLVAAMTSGFMIVNYGARSLYVITLVPVVVVVGPTVLGYFEEQVANDEVVAQMRERFAKQKAAVFLVFITLAGVVILAVVGIMYADPLLNGMVATGVAIVLLVCFSIVLTPAIAKFNAFALLQETLCLSTGGAAFYFFTDDADQYPEGPHFKPFFYNTVMGTSGYLCSLLGIYLYNRYMSGWRYQYIFVVSNVVYAFLAMLDVIIFSRLNVQYGIPDHFFMLSTSVLQNVVDAWWWMPGVVIYSYLCPKGMEATMYALLAGCTNLGASIAKNVGAALLHYLGCRPTGAVGESSQFENLWCVALIAGLLPVVTIFLIFHLVPDVKQGDPILDGDERFDCTSGSLWRRWTERT